MDGWLQEARKEVYQRMSESPSGKSGGMKKSDSCSRLKGGKEHKPNNGFDKP